MLVSQHLLDDPSGAQTGLYLCAVDDPAVTVPVLVLCRGWSPRLMPQFGHNNAKAHPKYANQHDALSNVI